MPKQAVILSGSLGRAIPARQGDTFTLRMTDQPPLMLTFA